MMGLRRALDARLVIERFKKKPALPRENAGLGSFSGAKAASGNQP
jgi:hypothetical protein